MERRWLATLLENEKAVAPLLKLLKATGIGGREGAKERELELAKKHDQEGERKPSWIKLRRRNPKVAIN